MMRTLLILAWPVVLSRSAQAVVSFSDALMTAPLGEAALAATTAAGMNIFALFMLPMGTAFIVQSFAAQYWGRNDPTGVRRYGWYGLILAGVAGIVFAGMIPGVASAAGAFAYAPDVRDYITEYTTIRLLAAGAVIGTEALGNWYGGIGNTRLHMQASLIIMVLNVVLNWFLIEGHGGAPALGVSGAALASVVASWAGFLFLLVLFLRRHAFVSVPEPRLHLREFGRMLRFGLPNGMNWFMEFAAFMFFINVVVADLGTVTLAALLAVVQVNSVAFMPAFGLASAGAILVGQSIGRGQPEQVGPIVRRTIAAAAAWQLSVGAIYASFPEVVMAWFAPNATAAVVPTIVTVGAPLLALSALWQLFDSFGITLSEALRAAGDTAWCLWARLLLAWMFFVPSAYLVVVVWNGGGQAAILSLVAYLALLAAALTWRFRTGAWRRIDLLGPGSPPLESAIEKLPTPIESLP